MFADCPAGIKNNTRAVLAVCGVWWVFADRPAGIKNNTRVVLAACGVWWVFADRPASIKNNTLEVGICYFIYIFTVNYFIMEKHITKWMPGENSIGELFNAFPELNVRQVARAMGVNETLMQQYVNGSKRPSTERRIEIECYLHSLAERLASVKLL